ncbi:hypothetical protein A3F00_04790 [Candidatus Daviesbacteria bacterium RIFCSPHIGHO2_12_FULL_37_11]|uniref:Amidohydrolase-related domain-containing protein n=1 Tax=Candidatus Daviesbacteria bacterium RIFCSPHIGHO2_12_FULL_37_11 TaxID=1797777 RepID=A0A1F5KAV7_9BACT|nr:MAG: hypothetical protein A2111_02025 [Candidatus Daviesbacteria bacterium GWA1_38_6]OGE15861.1 MAG: hypothetical protein A2769_01685 [Candidatus Daviesbacteria bacterium RIFCSPHIGHO2_01_FULL_37_27]OGE38086.1 MAG: hypothetical protein A3F00_04790 [Candidatus Daviesbacteria bacterium RIFCSPHIGHO2_12_FULL_37_11]OGE44940.1 MAG: hypothetical protein A3B39_02480 [Candidatus Daviesbacteria bacterium RIFCSPLOWO2_01_FULL_37_10]
MIIDVHTHVGKMGGKIWTPRDLLASMDEAGIDYSILITLEEQPENRQLTVEEIIKVCEKSPRLIPVGRIDYNDSIDKQINEMTGYLKEKKIVGVKFYLGYQKYHANDSKLHPIYKFCQDYNFPVIYHTGMLETGFPGLLKSSHPLTIDEVADTFPNLKIVMAHTGNPWIMDCAAVVAKNKNVYMDFSGYFTEYQSLDPEEVEMFIRQLKDFKIFAGFKKCMFGTDWPLYPQKEYLEVSNQLIMTEEEKELVFWKNAKEVFNLKV